MVSFDPSDVSFLQKGKGKDLVFFHGYLSSKEAFTAQIDYFSKFFKVTAFDFLGFGKSEPLKEPFSVSDYADWTAQLFRFLGLSCPFVIAHSFGCRVAVKMAKSSGQVFDKMLLTGAAGIVLNHGSAYKIKVGAYRAVKRIFPAFADAHFGSEEYRSLSPLMKESYKKIVNEDLREDAKLVQNQVLIAQGTKDRTTTFKEAEIYLKSFPNARVKMLSGGHFSFAEHPLEFNLLAEEFFYG